MRGEERRQRSMLLVVNLEERIPKQHPLRRIKQMTELAAKSTFIALNYHETDYSQCFLQQPASRPLDEAKEVSEIVDRFHQRCLLWARCHRHVEHGITRSARRTEVVCGAFVQAFQPITRILCAPAVV